MAKPWRRAGHPVAEGAVVLDVRHLAGLVVDLDVGPAVPVALAGDQPGLARVVGEHPARRVGDREGEPSARAQHPRRLGDRIGDVGDELQRAERAEDDVEGLRRRTAAAWRCRARTVRRLRSRRRCAGSAAAGGSTGRARPVGRPARRPSASTGRRPSRPRARRARRHRPARPARPRCGPRAPTRTRCRRGTRRAWPGTRRRSGPSRGRWPGATRLGDRAPFDAYARVDGAGRRLSGTCADSCAVTRRAYAGWTDAPSRA